MLKDKTLLLGLRLRAFMGNGLYAHELKSLSFNLCAVTLFVASALLFAQPAFAESAPGTAYVRSSSMTDTNFLDTEQYRYAELLLEGGEYSGSAREFSRLIENFPLSKLVGPAQLGMARAHFYAGRYGDAKKGAALFLKNFPQSGERKTALKLLKSAGQLLYNVTGATPQVSTQKADDAVTQTEAAVKPAPEKEEKEEQESSVAQIEVSKTQGTDDSIAAVKSMRTMVAVQVPFFTQSDYKDIAAEMKRLQSTGINTVIVRVFHNRGDRYYPVAVSKDGARKEAGVYFKTGHAPVVDDLLGSLVELAHKSGLEIFAWMTTRYADYGLEERDDMACTAYDLNRRKMVRCRGLDLFNPEAVEHLEALYSDLAEYDIDGVLFQDDLVLRQTEGFGEHAKTLFEAEYRERPVPELLYVSKGPGLGVDYTPLFWRWAEWKNRRLLDVAARLKAAVRYKNPEVRFAINLMYESVTNPPYALAWLSQDLVAAVDEGFDYYSIMAYHRQMENELNKRPIAIRGLISKMVKDAARTVKDPSKVLVKLQIVDWDSGESINDAEVKEVLKEVAKSGGVSIAVVPHRDDFPYAVLSNDNGVTSVLLKR